MLHRLAELDGEVRAAYAAYDYRKVVALLSQFMNTELSAFYFDIRKDALYCEPYSSVKRRAALDRHRRDLQRPRRLAGADPRRSPPRRLGSRGTMAEKARAGLGAPARRSPSSRSAWRNDELAQKWERCATCAASSPARWSSSARPSASARVSRPRLTSTSPTAPCSARARGRRPRRGGDHQRRDASSPRCRRRTRSRCPTCPASASCRSARRASKCARSWRDHCRCRRRSGIPRSVTARCRRRARVRRRAPRASAQ